MDKIEKKLAYAHFDELKSELKKALNLEGLQ